MAHPLVLFADDVMSLTLGKLTLENGTQSVSFQLEGGPYIDVPCDKRGLDVLKLMLVANDSPMISGVERENLLSRHAGTPEFEFAYIVKRRCADVLPELMEIVGETVERMVATPDVPERIGGPEKSANTGFTANPFE